MTAMSLNIKPLEGPKPPYCVEEISPSDTEIKELKSCAQSGMDTKDREYEARSGQQRRLKEIIDKAKWYRKLWVIS